MLSDTVHPVFDIWGQPEHAAPRGDVLGWGFASCPAVAAQYSRVQLWNPATSNRLIVVETWYGHGAANMGAYISDTALTNIATTRGVRDLRMRQTPLTVWGENWSLAQVRHAAAAAIGGEQRTYVIGGVRYDEPVVLRPGTGLMIAHLTVNTTHIVDFWWREHTMFPGEHSSEFA